VRWYDGSVRGEVARETTDVQASGLAAVALLPVRGGRQADVVPAVMRDVMLAVALRVTPLYLVGDPRRHALAVQVALDAGATVQLIGVSDGERTPARRMWLRRPEVMRTLVAGADRRPRPAAGRRDGYRPPAAHGTAIRPRLPPFRDA
jgi:hypothetical protein